MRDLATGRQLLAKPIADTAGNVAWASDNKTLFYVTKDKLDRWGGAAVQGGGGRGGGGGGGGAGGGGGRGRRVCVCCRSHPLSLSHCLRWRTAWLRRRARCCAPCRPYLLPRPPPPARRPCRPPDRPYKVWRHVIGSDPSADACVYHEEDESFYIGISRSRSEQLLYIHAGADGAGAGVGAGSFGLKATRG